MPRAPSALDTSLIGQAVERGCALNSRQLKRWRELGLIPYPDRISRGRGQGTESHYSPEVAEYVLSVAAQRREARPMWEPVLKIFDSGGFVPEPCLRSALDLSLHKWPFNDDDNAVERADRADRVASRARRLKRAPAVDRYKALARQLMTQRDLGASSLGDAHEGLLSNTAVAVAAPSELAVEGLETVRDAHLAESGLHALRKEVSAEDLRTTLRESGVGRLRAQAAEIPMRYLEAARKRNNLLRIGLTKFTKQDHRDVLIVAIMLRYIDQKGFDLKRLELDN